MSVSKKQKVAMSSTTDDTYKQDGPEAKAIAAVIPYYPFHGVDRFYDISGMTHNPEIFQQVIDIFVKRYIPMGFDKIAGLDARGFILGPPIALALKKPFIMIRKSGKLPNAISGSTYTKEYSAATGSDELCMSRTAITPGDRVLVLDDLIATGVHFFSFLFFSFLFFFLGLWVFLVFWFTFFFNLSQTNESHHVFNM